MSANKSPAGPIFSPSCFFNFLSFFLGCPSFCACLFCMCFFVLSFCKNKPPASERLRASLNGGQCLRSADLVMRYNRGLISAYKGQNLENTRVTCSKLLCIKKECEGKTWENQPQPALQVEKWNMSCLHQRYIATEETIEEARGLALTFPFFRKSEQKLSFGKLTALVLPLPERDCPPTDQWPTDRSTKKMHIVKRNNDELSDSYISTHSWKASRVAWSNTTMGLKIKTKTYAKKMHLCLWNEGPVLGPPGGVQFQRNSAVTCSIPEGSLKIWVACIGL